MAPTEIRMAILALLALLGAAGCTRQQEADSGHKPGDPVAASAAGTSSPIREVNVSLEKGAFDDAAAKLLALRASGRAFSESEAAEYRRALNEAYTQALEAADRGDKRAEAAIQMIRAQGQ